jgi:hypothetical protein
VWKRPPEGNAAAQPFGPPHLSAPHGKHVFAAGRGSGSGREKTRTPERMSVLYRVKEMPRRASCALNRAITAHQYRCAGLARRLRAGGQVGSASTQRNRSFLALNFCLVPGLQAGKNMKQVLGIQPIDTPKHSTEH